MSETTCSVDGCDTTGPMTRGWCAGHYRRWRLHGDVRPGVPLRRGQTGPCEAGGCERPKARRSWCTTHYQRVQKYGTPELPEKASRACQAQGCPDERRTAQFCARHYFRWKRYGDPLIQQRERNNRPPEHCQQPDCNAPHYANDPCGYCGAPGEAVDHFFPLAKGGTDHWWNLVRACAWCNGSKAARCGTWFRLMKSRAVAL